MSRIPLLLAFALISSSAHARSPHVVRMKVQLPVSAEPDPWGQPGPVYQTVGEPGARGPDLEGPIVESGKLSMQCSVEAGMAYVKVIADTGNYPEHLPEFLECVVGDNVFRVKIVPIANLYTRPEELWIDPVAGVELRHHPGWAYSDMSRFAIPPELDLQPAESEGMQGDQRWGDLTCRVMADQRPVLLVSYSHKAQDGEGSCVLPTSTGTYTLRVVVREVPRKVGPAPEQAAAPRER